MRLFQRSGRNSVNIQANGDIEANAIGNNSVVVRGSDNWVAGPGAYNNVFSDSTVSTNGRINIKSGNLSITSDGKTIHIKGAQDLNVYLNDVKLT